MRCVGAVYPYDHHSVFADRYTEYRNTPLLCCAAGDLNTAVYGYTSSADVAAAPSSGLVGAVVIAGRGQLQANMLPVGVDLMVPLYWQVGWLTVGGGWQF